jgi:periplasmic divalent cation tolerance protein
MNDYLVALITAESQEQARRIGRALVERKLAACVNRVPVVSIFAWQGQVEEQGEVLLIVKTRAAVFDALIAAVRELHSYDVPEIIALPIVRGSADYLQWISDETGG